MIDLEQQTDNVRLLFQINREMVNAIWFGFENKIFEKISLCVQIAKTTPISRNIVRETGDSRHNGSQIEGPPETTLTIPALSYWAV